MVVISYFLLRHLFFQSTFTLLHLLTRFWLKYQIYLRSLDCRIKRTKIYPTLPLEKHLQNPFDLTNVKCFRNLMLELKPGSSYVTYEHGSSILERFSKDSKPTFLNLLQVADPREMSTFSRTPRHYLLTLE